MANLKITLVKSVSGSNKKQIATVDALGHEKLARLERPDNAAVRGMISMSVTLSVLLRSNTGMKINEVKQLGRQKKAVRKGRGWFRTRKTSGRGPKEHARGGKGPMFEGGQMPLFRRLPKRGFNTGIRSTILL